jgi:hypothetical protein
MYVYQYNASDVNNQPADDDGYRSPSKNNVEVSVCAADELEAQTKAKSVVTREQFRLTGVAEIIEGTVARVSGF